MKRIFNKIGLVLLALFCLGLLVADLQMAAQLVTQKNMIDQFKAQHIELRERIIKLTKENELLKEQVVRK